MYYVWFYEQVQMITYLYAVLAVVVIFAVVLFPLWPVKMRIGVWYISIGMLGLLGFFFVIAIIRLILFVISYFILPKGFWLFPNLFEDVGFFESFVPLYSWSGDKVVAASIEAAAKAKKRKQLKKKRKEEQEKEKNRLLGEKMEEIAKKAASKAPAITSTPVGPVSANPGPQIPLPPGFENLDPTAKAVVTSRLLEISSRMERRKAEIVQSGQPLPQTPEAIQAFTAKLFQEEANKYKLELLQAAAAAQSSNQPPSNTTPAKRIVTLEEESEESK